MKVRSVVSSAVVGSVALAASSCATPRAATPVPFGGTYSSAGAVSDTGGVYGSRSSDPTASEVVVADAAGVRAIASFGFRTSGTVNAVNGAGTAVGFVLQYGTGGIQARYPASFAEGQDARRLALPAGYAVGEASDVNAAGVIVGTVAGSTGVSAVVWAPDGTVARLAHPSGQGPTSAYGIDDRGDIVGSAQTAEGTRAVIWEGAARTPRLLPAVAVPGATTIEAVDLNEAGLVIGRATGGANDRAVVWVTPTTGGVQLPGTGTTIAHAVNEAGVIVGGERPGELIRAVAWTTTTSLPTQLAGDDQSPSIALDVNESGAVVGNARFDGVDAAARFTLPAGG